MRKKISGWIERNSVGEGERERNEKQEQLQTAPAVM